MNPSAPIAIFSDLSGALFQDRFVGVVAVVLLRQDRDVGLLDQINVQISVRDFVQRGIDREEVDARARCL